MSRKQQAKLTLQPVPNLFASGTVRPGNLTTSTWWSSLWRDAAFVPFCAARELWYGMTSSPPLPIASTIDSSKSSIRDNAPLGVMDGTRAALELAVGGTDDGCSKRRSGVRVPFPGRCRTPDVENILPYRAKNCGVRGDQGMRVMRPRRPRLAGFSGFNRQPKKHETFMNLCCTAGSNAPSRLTWYHLTQHRSFHVAILKRDGTTPTSLPTGAMWVGPDPARRAVPDATAHCAKGLI
jgi:hypothetical protein